MRNTTANVNAIKKVAHALGDLEDITYLLDNTTKPVDIILGSPEDVRSFLQKEFTEIKRSDLLKEGIHGNLSYQTRNERFKIIVEQFDLLCKES